MVLLRNMGDLPLTFSLDNSSKNALTESVSVIPKCGLIQPKNYQILTLRTKPSEDSPNEGFGLQLQLNAAKFTKVQSTNISHTSTVEGVVRSHADLLGLTTMSIFFCPLLGAHGCQCDRKAQLVSGWRLQIEFSTDIYRLHMSTLPQHEEPQLYSSSVSSLTLLL